jgi:DNA-binding XRE family transcriptional regulator
MGRQKEDPLFNRIEAARTAQGLSGQALADAVGVHYQTIGYLERGEYSPSLTLALRLAEVLGCSVQDLSSARPFDAER